MPFLVIPAVDVVGGRLGALSRGRPARIDAFGGDAVRAAETFVQAGATWIHVVDVDLAFTGNPGALEAMGRIAALPVRVQASGGLASARDVDTVLAAGATRAVLGSAAIADRDLAGSLIRERGERLVVGLEVDGENIRPRGRGEGGERIDDVLPWLLSAGAARFLVTDVSRVGERSGPDLDGVARVARATGLPVIAAGGIGSIADLEALAALDPPIEGAIVGRVLYEGGIDLAAAVRAVGGSPGP